MSLLSMAYVYFFVYALVLSLSLLPIVRALALHYCVVAVPKKDRFHKVATPLLGGVAIICAFYFTIIINLVCVKLGLPILSYYAHELLPYCEGALKSVPKLALILGCGFLIFSLGLVDDLKVLGPKRKFIFELAVGVLLYVSDIRVTVFGGFELINMLCTVLWVVTITNAFNLLDNIDGLAAGVAVIASFILFLFCVQGGQVIVAFLLMAFMGSVLGFLRFNYPPAKIFMGDSGSLFIGFIMSALMIKCTFHYESGVSLMPVVAPIMILSVPIYDTLSVVLIRLKNKKSPFVGDKNHFSHRLLKVGMSTRQAVGYIYLVGLSTGVGALSLWQSSLQSQIVLLVQTVLLIMLLHHLKGFKQKNNGVQRKG